MTDTKNRWLILYFCQSYPDIRSYTIRIQRYKKKSLPYYRYIKSMTDTEFSIPNKIFKETDDHKKTTTKQ
jgi:hypothetical protein